MKNLGSAGEGDQPFQGMEEAPDMRHETDRPTRIVRKDQEAASTHQRGRSPL